MRGLAKDHKKRGEANVTVQHFSGLEESTPALNRMLAPRHSLSLSANNTSL